MARRDPTELLQDSAHAGFRVVVRVEIYAPAVGDGRLTVLGGWPGATAVHSQVRLQRGGNNATVEIEASQTRKVRLWNVNGMGDQTRYSITASFQASRPGAAEVSAQRMLGFRHVALITVNDTDGKPWDFNDPEKAWKAEEYVRRRIPLL